MKSDLSACGGLEKATLRIAQGFLDRGADLSILTGDSASLPRWPKSLRLERYDRFVRNWIREHQPDLIFGMERTREQTHLRAGNGVHAAYLETRGLFKRLTALLSPFHAKILELERTGFTHPRLQKIFTNSHMVKGEILHFYPVDPSKIEVIHNGVEWEEMQRDFDEGPERKVLFMREHGLDLSQFHFLFIGNGYARKGLKELLYAFAETKEGHLSIVGKESRESSYQALAARLGLKGRVTFFGRQKNVRRFYQFADAVVIPSLYDPFANVTVEALAMGLFVVSSKSNGGHEILTDKNGAIISDLFNRDSLTFALKEALSHPKTPMQALSIRKSVRNLDYSLQTKKLIDSCCL